MAGEMAQFLQAFYDESFEGLDIMESGLLNLDVGQADIELVNEIFRAAHSIKGGSATFGLPDVADFTHLLETLLDELRDGRRKVTQELVDLLLESVDALRELLSSRKKGEERDSARTGEIEARLQQVLGSEPVPAPRVAADTTPERAAESWKIIFRPHPHLYSTGNDPVRIFRELAELGELKSAAELSGMPPFAQLDPEMSYLSWSLELTTTADLPALREVFAWVEDDCDLEISPAVPMSVPEAEPAMSGELLVERRKSGDRRNGTDRRGVGKAESGSIRVNIEKIDAVINLVGELVITQSMLSTLGENFEMGMLHKLRDGLAQLERNTRELQEDVMRMRMLPISSVFQRFPRLVHDLSAQLGKEAELQMSGESTELDKTLVEKITDPLVHLVRNALDHGIESVEERREAGKPTTGKVSLNAYHKGGNVVIEVQDDGRGLFPQKIFAKAVERGIVAPEVELSEEQIYELLFLPGFSTAEKVSDISGRGVGMDVVRRNIQSLNGTVEVRSEPHKGSVFTIRLPLTLAILDGQSVAVGSEVYIVPLVSISESIQIKPGMVSHVAGKGDAFQWRGDYLRIIRLGELFGVQSKARELSEGLLVVVEGEGRHVGLFVDDLLGQQQVVIKSMEENYKRVDGISGATILGDGSVALILDIPSLIRRASRETVNSAPRRVAVAG